MKKHLTLQESDTMKFLSKVETRTSIIAEFKNKILQLDKYSAVYERGIGVLKHKDGEYVKIEDILNLF